MLANFYVEKNIYKDYFEQMLNKNRFLYQKILFSNTDITNYPTEEYLVKHLPLNINIIRQYCGEDRVEFGVNTMGGVKIQ